MIVVGSGIQAFLVKMIFLDGLACRLSVFLRKGETAGTGTLKFTEERGTEIVL